MWQRSPFRHAVGVELDAELSTLARNNVAQFHLEDKIHVLQTDIRLLGSRGSSRHFSFRLVQPV